MKTSTPINNHRIVREWEVPGRLKTCTVFVLLLFSLLSSGQSAFECIDNEIFYLHEGEAYYIRPRDISRSILSNDQMFISIDKGARQKRLILTLADSGHHDFEIIDTVAGQFCFGSFFVKANCKEDICKNYIKIDDKYANPGEEFCIKISGETSDPLGGLQIPLKWNPDVLTFKSVSEAGALQNWAFNDSQEGLVKLLHIKRGSIFSQVGYFDFFVCFEAIGESGAWTTIDFVDVPLFPFEYARARGIEVTMTKKPGRVSILSENLCQSSENADCTTNAVVVFPNPTHDIFTLFVPDNMIGKTLSIFSSMGKLEYEAPIENTLMQINSFQLETKGVKYIGIGRRIVDKVLIGY